MAGYIKDHRKELDSEIWLMPPLYHRVWQYLKYMVNHKEVEIPMNDGTTFTVQAGQHLTSVRTIAKGVGWYEGRVLKEPNPKTVSTILSWLEKRRMILVSRGKGNRQYTLITLINWRFYQQDDVSGNSKVTVGKQLADINKNDKEITTTTTARETDDDFEKLIGAFCEIHGKLDIHIKPVDIQLMQELFSQGVPVDLMIQVMTTLYTERTAKGAKISSFSYYKNAILQAWEVELLASQTTVTGQTTPAPTGTVAPASVALSGRPETSHYRKTKNQREVDDLEQFIAEEVAKRGKV